ncbi:hypothetical protein SASPL_126314 [Salvia splendens]|uniref:Fatty acyl-CoA reductase n=1 Tax=Salvia splendens TaxID=180675 RepID=A0A8X8XK88_SALSN|nr:hypothetical protein SASPL_126314 [Salvia splendens]
MEAVSLNSSISYGVKASNFNHRRLLTRRRRSMVCCQTGSHAIKSTGISSVLTETSSALISQDHGPALMETGSLVLSPNGKDEGIGIVKFLRGKTFLITGATGFLGKVLIEKMLRTAPDVHKIFVLIKAKSKEAGAERLKNEVRRALLSYIYLSLRLLFPAIMEKPFCIGETIAGETVNGNHQILLPKLSVEDEIKIVVEAKKTLGNDSLLQAMKELGLQSSSPIMDSTGTPVHVPKMKLFSSMDDFSDHLWKDAINRTGLGALTNLEGKLSQKLEFICRKSVEQAKYLASIYESYTFYGGRFDNRNTQRLMGCMSKEERQQFGFEVENINWKDYIINVHIPGLRRHVMKGRGNS